MENKKTGIFRMVEEEDLASPGTAYVECQDRCFLVAEDGTINHPSIVDGEEVVFYLKKGDRKNAYGVKRLHPVKVKNYPPGYRG